jgi:hypothetical protein
MDSLDKRPKLIEMDMRFGMWHISSTYRAGSLKTVAREILNVKLDIRGA